ncbi:hypothetical protein ACT3R7_05675 [Halomonas sp. AOP43-A1-21]|uniref:Uncharacterized protein n=1 Tax=Halomonas colorata TaxID=2742615 RepID=A0ABR9FWA7_9GAMM|nr:hypothetical protein [Halomonas colorata]MBE0462926.1 hypothetical protein [Halomonas colorata]
MKILPQPAYFAGFKGLKVLILTTALALAACTWYVFFHRLHDGHPTAGHLTMAICDLNGQACSAILGDGGRLTLQINIDRSAKAASQAIMPMAGTRHP